MNAGTSRSPAAAAGAAAPDGDPDLDGSLFARACRREPVPRPPVWMMRQAGRYLPEYRAVRARVDFQTLCRTPDLAAEVTLQPVDLLGVEAAVIFSDILVVLEGVGLEVEFPGEGGPRIGRPIRSGSEVDRLAGDLGDLGYVNDAIARVAAVLTPRGIPVLGFAGAPFTLAAYAVEGETSREFVKTRRMLRSEPAAFGRLLERLAIAGAEHCVRQVRAGAYAVQLFDTWAGLLGEDEYRRWMGPVLKGMVETIQAAGAPVIVYANGSAPHLETMAATGADVVSVDWRVPLDKVRERVGPGVALQGNFDPTALYAGEDTVRAETEAMLARHPGPGWIANLGHGLLPDVPVSNVRMFVETVKGWSNA